MKGNRIEYIDIMKGLGILLVVLHHVRIIPIDNPGMSTLLWKCLSMPLFFFVAGLTFSSKRSFSDTFVRGFRRLIVPAIFWSLLAGFCISIISDEASALTIFSPYVWLLKWPNVPLYFLRAMFTSILIMWLLTRTARTWLSQWIVGAALLGLSAVAFIFSPHFGELPMWLRPMLHLTNLLESAGLLVFFWAGYMLAAWRHPSKLAIGRLPAVAVLLLCLAAAYLIGLPQVRWHEVQLQGPLWLVWPCAALGITAIWAAANLLRGVRIASLLGRESMAVLLTHYFVMLAAMEIFDAGRLQVAPIVLLTIPLCILLCRRLPALSGNPQPRKEAEQKAVA